MNDPIESKPYLPSRKMKRPCRHRLYDLDEDSGVYTCRKCGEHFDFCTKCGEIVPQEAFQETGGYCNEKCVTADEAEAEADEDDVEPIQPAPLFLGTALALPPPEGNLPIDDIIKIMIGEIVGGKKAVDTKKVEKRKRDEFLPSQKEVEKDRELGTFKIRKILGETCGLYLVEWEDGVASWEPLEAIQSSKVYQTWRV